MSKHTPGPWAAFTSIRNGVVGTGTVAVEQTRAPVAEVSAGLLETVKANARLIAAAPDLLEAARGALVTFERRFPDSPTTADLRAAIAKADGAVGPRGQ